MVTSVQVVGTCFRLGCALLCGWCRWLCAGGGKFCRSWLEEGYQAVEGTMPESVARWAAGDSVGWHWTLDSPGARVKHVFNKVMDQFRGTNAVEDAVYVALPSVAAASCCGQ